jgi:hypothetical protein
MELDRPTSSSPRQKEHYQQLCRALHRHDLLTEAAMSELGMELDADDSPTVRPNETESIGHRTQAQYRTF